MDANDLIAKYDRLVPRYTSYPTAPHFSSAITPGVYAAWLGALPADAPLSLYLHVPFCASLCLFCACHTTAVNQLPPLRAYASTLLEEIDLVARAIGRRQKIQHVHWGGGTPTSLPPQAMLDIIRHLRAHFDIAGDAEIAVEIDPRSLTDASVETLAAMGTTRASLGVQDFDPVVQQAINRHQDLALTRSCAQRLRQAGIRSLNLDLIYGLPYQTTAGLRDTVHQALTLRPDRVAVFGYAHVPWMKKHQALIPDASLPGRDERFAQRAVAEATILDAGYVAVGLDHFALPDDELSHAAADHRLKRNFQGYTTDSAPILLGLGASSIGSMPEGYVQNHASVPAWRDAVRSGTLPVARGIALTADDRLRRDVIGQIMCDLTVDLAATAAHHDASPAALMDAAPALQEMARDGLVLWNGYSLSVTPAGRPFVRNVAAAFDTWLRPGTGRHSAAV